MLVLCELTNVQRAVIFFFFFQAEDGIRDYKVTGVQTCALPIWVAQLLGPFDVWQVCPHDEDAGCACRKPAPGMVHAAARALGTDPTRCVVVGDIGRDMVAAGAAGALGVLVPTEVTPPAESAAPPVVMPHLAAAA